MRSVRPFAEHPDAEILDFGGRLGFELFDTSEEFIDFVDHILPVYAFSVFFGGTLYSVQSYKKIEICCVKRSHLSRSCCSLRRLAGARTPATGQSPLGVVMSGGGAKGLYHIGVLEALEECGVPIDCARSSRASMARSSRPCMRRATPLRRRRSRSSASAAAGAWSGVGFLWAHRPQPLPRLLPAGGEQPLVPEPAHRRRRPCGETVPRADEPRLLHADRHGAHRAVRSGDGRCRRRFRPSDGPLPLRGQRHEPPPSGGAAAGRAERGGALLDVHSPGVQARGGGFDAALRRRHLRQLPVEAARRDVRSRFHRGIGLHLGQHPAQRRQQHHGPGFHAGHAGDRLHAARGAQRHDPPGRGCRDARLRPGRGHHGLGLRGRHGRHARNPAAGRRTPRRDRLRRAPRTPSAGSVPR